jgi:DNA-binding transcriptional regulator YiaG
VFIPLINANIAYMQRGHAGNRLAGHRETLRLRQRNGAMATDPASSRPPSQTGSFLRMRKLLQVKRGDWAALVKHVRAETRLKPGVLAKRAGVSPETWWRWENGRQRPKEADAVERFAHSFSDTLEVDDAMWAAGLLLKDPNAVDEPDPRLEGLDPSDELVREILSLEQRMGKDWTTFALARRRQILELRRQQDKQALEIEVKQMKRDDRPEGNVRGAA